MAFGFFDRIKEGLEKTRKSFVKNVEKYRYRFMLKLMMISQMIQKQLCSLVTQVLKRQNT